MNPLLFSIGGLVFAIGIFKREWLVQRSSFTVILAISIALFVTGLVLRFVGPPPGNGSLFSPLVSLVLYRLFYRFFVMTYQREPLDTWLDWHDGLYLDRVFNILYFLTAGIVWAVLAAYL